MTPGAEKGKLTMPSSTPVRKVFQHAVFAALSMTLVMLLVTWTGTFDTAKVELGLDHYAERHPSWLPDYVPMPLNTIINAGYVLCALHWALLTRRSYLERKVTDADAYFFFVFNTMGFVYGFVQLYRILAQTLRSAIMDQWYTLPFFMLVHVWAQSSRGKCTWPRCYALMCASVVSYSLTLLTPVGFELSLGCHTLFAVIGAYVLYRENPSDCALRYFLLGIAACCGFVVLKLMDHHLPLVHWIFTYVSGHFISKICDVLQFHFSNNFFFSILVGRSTDTVQKTRRMKVN